MSDPLLDPPRETNPADYANGAEQLRRFVRNLSALLRIADDLEKIGSLQNAITESQGRLAPLDQEIESARVAVASAREQAKEILADAETKADQVRIDAASAADKVRAEAEELLDKARNVAARIVADAKAEADKIGSQLRREMVERADELLKGARAE